MVRSNDAVVTPLYLDSGTRRLFSIYYAPAEHARIRRAFVYVPPFAEEMNLARRMVALQARALAACGIEVLVLDLFGTGDSEGDFRDARWELWLNDVLAAADWMERKVGAPVGLWGLRLGGLLAAVVAANQPSRFKRLLLWQPVIDGKSMVTQFLRIRIAASLGSENAAETTKGLRADLAAGRSVEVAGYDLSAELAQALNDVRLDRLDLPHTLQVHWYEVGPHVRDQLSRAVERIAGAWRERGVSVTVFGIAGDPFWSVPESPPVAELLAATARNANSWQ